MEDRGGRVEVLLPYATLEPIRDLLLQGFMGEKFGRDSIWEGHLASEIWSTDILIDAVLQSMTLPLRNVMNFAVGETVLFNCSPEDPVIVRCNGIPLTEGLMGRSGNNIAIKVNRGINKPKHILPIAGPDVPNKEEVLGA